MTQPDQLEYPALCFARDNSVSVARSPTELSSCNALAWFTNQYFDDLRVVDATATPFRVRSAALSTPLPGWRQLLARLTNASLLASIELERLGAPSLSEAKRTAIEWIRRTPDYWEAAFGLPEWERLISEATSIEALCELFS